MRKLLMSMLRAGSLLGVSVGPVMAQDASAPAAASAAASDTTAAAPASAPDTASAATAASAAAPASGASDAAPAAPTEPFSVDSSKISAGDTAWMLTSTALVLFMTIPGLALF